MPAVGDGLAGFELERLFKLKRTEGVVSGALDAAAAKSSPVVSIAWAKVHQLLRHPLRPGLSTPQKNESPTSTTRTGAVHAR